MTRTRSRGLRVDSNLFQQREVRRQLRRASRKSVLTQNVSDDVGVLLRRQLARLFGRRGHRPANAVEEIADGLVVPTGQEVRAGERRGAFGAS